eukprot:gene4793-8379_t
MTTTKKEIVTEEVDRFCCSYTFIPDEEEENECTMNNSKRVNSPRNKPESLEIVENNFEEDYINEQEEEEDIKIQEFESIPFEQFKMDELSLKLTRLQKTLNRDDNFEQIKELKKDLQKQIQTLLSLSEEMRKRPINFEEIKLMNFEKLNEFEKVSSEWFKILTKLNAKLIYEEHYTTFELVSNINKKVIDRKINQQLKETNKKLKKKENEIINLYTKIENIEKVLGVKVKSKYDLAAIKIQKIWKRKRIIKKWRVLVDQFCNSKEGKELGERNKIISEIANTERIYVRSINEMKQLYVIELKKIAMNENKKKSFISFKDIENMFLNIEQIVHMHQIFLNEIEGKIENWPRIYLGEAFSNHISFFSIYENYINRYDKALKNIKLFKQKNFEFQEFCDNNQLKTTGNQSINSLFIMPVQRLPRYKLLLDQLIKHTPTEHIDYNDLVNARDKISKTVLEINQKKKEYEDEKIVNEFINSIGNKKSQELDLNSRLFIISRHITYIKDDKTYNNCNACFFKDMILICSIKNTSFSQFLSKPKNTSKKGSFSNSKKGSFSNSTNDQNNEIIEKMNYLTHIHLDSNSKLISIDPNFIIKVNDKFK